MTYIHRYQLYLFFKNIEAEVKDTDGKTVDVASVLKPFTEPEE